MPVPPTYQLPETAPRQRNLRGVTLFLPNDSCEAEPVAGAAVSCPALGLRQPGPAAAAFARTRASSQGFARDPKGKRRHTYVDCTYENHGGAEYPALRFDRNLPGYWKHEGMRDSYCQAAAGKSF